MCGRCACTIPKTHLSKACSYRDSNNKLTEVPWHDTETNCQYFPSCNLSPGQYLPVVTSGEHVERKEKRVLMEMLWGMIPPYWNDEPTKHGYKTINARIETIKERFYKNPLAQGKRCVLVVEGYYEWKTTKNSKFKQPYFIYSAQNEERKMEDSSWKINWNEEKGWNGVALLKMAGLFNKYYNSKNGETIYSFTVITKNSDEVLSWLHDRQPIFLQNSEDEEAWLNYHEVSADAALSRLMKITHPSCTLNWHPVSTNVNNAKYQNSDCIMPIKLREEENRKSSNLMSAWLKQSSTKKVNKRELDQESSVSKRTKLD